MSRSVRVRFVVLAALILVLALVGLGSIPFLQRCCSDPPLPYEWPEPPDRSLLDRLLFMDMAPRLAGLAAAAGIAALVALAGIYLLTEKAESREAEGRTLGYIGALRGIGAAFLVGTLYLYGLFVTGYFQLGWFNLVWIIGVPVLLAAMTGRNQFERLWGGAFLIIPGFIAMVALMIALGIGD